MSSNVKINFNNGTIVNAEDFYNATSKIITVPFVFASNMVMSIYPTTPLGELACLIYIGNSSYITIENCKITGGSVGTQIHGNSTNIRIIDCSFIDNQEYDLVISKNGTLEPKIIWIIDNYLTDVYNESSANITFRDNYPYTP